MKVEILGTGCAKCRLLEKRIKEAIKEMRGEDIEIIKIGDVGEIMKRGIIITPGLAINGEITAVGRIPSMEEIKEMLNDKNKK